MPRTFEQFVRFSTDAVGLERTLRLFQSITHLLSAYPETLNLILHHHPNQKANEAILQALKANLGQARRYFRLFRFLESFQAAQVLYGSLSQPQTKAQSQSQKQPQTKTATWLDVFAKTFNGMYLLLEATTTIDMLNIEGFEVWGSERARLVNVEAQRFWFFALVLGAFAGVLRIWGVFSALGVEVEGKGDGKGEKAVLGSGDEAKGGEKGVGSEGKDGHGSDAWTPETRSKILGLGRGVLANVLDIAVPGSVVGWVPASSGMVGLAMFVTTLLTGFDVWERCGREVGGGK